MKKEQKLPKIVNVSTKFGMKDVDILNQIKGEYKIGIESVSAKRKTRQNDIRTMYVPFAKKNKVSIHNIYTAVQTLMSVYYSDRMLVEFAGRKKSFVEQASNLNLAAEFDYDEMNLEQIDYKWHWNRFFHGVGVKVIDGWNKSTQTPIARNINPLAWIPDPQGGFTIEDHRWAGFELEETKGNMKNRKWQNVALVNKGTFSEQEEIRRAYQEGTGIASSFLEKTPNAKYAIYHHYCIIDGDKYLVVTANYNTVILNMIKLPASNKNEKANPSSIMFPIALIYYSPLEGDPLGISVPDLLKDKQSAESKLFNLTLITATRNALGDDKVYNPSKIKNVKQLQKPTEGGKMIAANIKEGETLGSVIMTVPKENPGSLPFNVQEQLRFQNSISTGMDSNTLGIQAGGGQTATEAQITQKNANLRFILGTKVAKWGEASFWKLWVKSLSFNLKPSSIKYIRVQNDVNVQFYEFSKKNLLTDEHIDIKIVSKSEKESIMNKQRANLFAIAPQFLQDPDIPKTGKMYLKRKMLRLSNLPEEEVMEIASKTIDERVAENDLELLSYNEEPSKIKEGQDHMTFINIFSTADDTDAKAKAIMDREEAYIKSGQKALEEAQQEQGGDTAANIAQSNASSRMSANMIRETNAENTPSLENV